MNFVCNNMTIKEIQSINGSLALAEAAFRIETMRNHVELPQCLSQTSVKKHFCWKIKGSIGPGPIPVLTQICFRTLAQGPMYHVQI